MGNLEMHFDGAKLAIISNGHVLTMLRDDKDSIPYPDMWDFAGGGRDGNETPQDCALRELFEEFGLRLSVDDLVFCAKRDGVLPEQLTIWFFGAKWDGLTAEHIKFGDEGQRWKFMPVATYLSHAKAIPHLQDGLRQFMQHLQQ